MPLRRGAHSSVFVCVHMCVYNYIKVHNCAYTYPTYPYIPYVYGIIIHAAMWYNHCINIINIMMMETCHIQPRLSASWRCCHDAVSLGLGAACVAMTEVDI